MSKLTANETAIYKAAIDGGLNPVLASLMVAQAKHETANFRSSVFRTNKNAFGYKYVKGAKWQVGSGKVSPEGNSYAQYESVYNSARDVAGWIKRRWKDFQNVKTPSEYASALKKNGYYGDTVTNYLKGLNAFFKSISPQAAGLSVAVAFFLSCL